MLGLGLQFTFHELPFLAESTQVVKKFGEYSWEKSYGSKDLDFNLMIMRHSLLLMSQKYISIDY